MMFATSQHVRLGKLATPSLPNGKLANWSCHASVRRGCHASIFTYSMAGAKSPMKRDKCTRTSLQRAAKPCVRYDR